MSLPFGPFGTAHGDFYARGLGHALRSYRLYDPDYALAQDPEAFDRLRRDPVVSFALRYRKLLAAGSDWFVEAAGATPADRKVAALFEGLLKQVRRFASARFHLAEAVIRGSAWARLEGEHRLLDLAGLGPRRWWCATRLLDVDKRRFRRMPRGAPPPGGADAAGVPPPGDGDGRVAPAEADDYPWELYRPRVQAWERIDRSHFVRHVYDDHEASLSYGSGLAGELYHYWYAKERVLEEGLAFVERWAQGILHVAIDGLRDGQATTAATARATQWLTELEKHRARHVLVHDKADEIKLEEAPQGGWSVAKDAIAYLDGALRVLILGASLPTEAEVAGGSFAMAKVQQGSTATLVGYDRTLLEETLTEDLLGVLWRANYPLLRELGLAGCCPPRLRIRDPRHDDPASRGQALLVARQLGLPVKLADAYAQLGFEPPAEGDELLAPPAPGEPAGPAPAAPPS